MTILKFKCTLLSDVILNMKSASEGNNNTLDFIPGNCFLGIVASQHYNDAHKDCLNDLFHNGTVRFGDAHPCSDGSNVRTLRTPAALFYPKLKKASEELWVMPLIPDPSDTAMREKQLKQCRTGFYAFNSDSDAASPAPTNKAFAIKSAYDRNQRRAMDEKMFGYESLQEGTSFFFTVEVDQDNLADLVKNALVGKRHIGRSRSAQYGLVEISEHVFEEVASVAKKSKTHFVLADSRLIFTDDAGTPTFRPDAVEHLHFAQGARIDWAKSQVRTFQYSPWNAKRQCFDADRCGIEKGSVLVVSSDVEISTPDECWVGNFNNEGFGHVIFNPSCLAANESGEASITLQEKKEQTPKDKNEPTEITEFANNHLFAYINKQINLQNKESETTKNVNDFVAANKGLFSKDAFASQWGAIRGLAMATKDKDKIHDAIKKFIGHGVKSKDWEGRRTDVLDVFMTKNQSNIREAVINLASEMAKVCSKKKNN